MPGPATRKPLYPNPFYVLLVLASTVFVVTVLGYLVAPYAQQKAKAGARSVALAGWFDRNGVAALTVEMVVMIASGALAMASDRWFPTKAERG